MSTRMSFLLELLVLLHQHGAWLLKPLSFAFPDRSIGKFLAWTHSLTHSRLFSWYLRAINAVAFSTDKCTLHFIQPCYSLSFPCNINCVSLRFLSSYNYTNVHLTPIANSIGRSCSVRELHETGGNPNRGVVCRSVSRRCLAFFEQPDADGACSP